MSTASHIVLSRPALPSQLNVEKALDTLEELLCVAAFSHCVQFAVISFSDLKPCIVFTASTASDCPETRYLSELFKHSHDTAFANHFDPSKRQLLLSLPPRPDNAHISFWESVALEDDDGPALGHLHIIDFCRTKPLDNQESNILRLHGKRVSSQLRMARPATAKVRGLQLLSRTDLHRDMQQLNTTQGQYLFVIDLFPSSYLNELTQILGYAVLEDTLLALDTAVQSSATATQVYYRLHPGRYALKLSGFDDATAEDLARSFALDFRVPLLCDQLPMQLAIRIGAVKLEEFSARQADWIRMGTIAAEGSRADNVAMRWYTYDIDALSLRKFTLARSFAAALESAAQLHLAYQPRINIQSGRIVAVEALLRWTHPQLGIIGPAEFIPIAERSGAIAAVSLWVMDRAVRQLAQWQQQGFAFKVGFNVSMADFANPLFTDRMIALIHSTTVDASGLELEITETATALDYKTINQQLARLIELGVQIALDDFGTGYSNWEHMRDLMIKTVKLDRSLINGLERHEKDRQLMSTLIRLLTLLGYEVVAEGVENAETCAALGALGCHQAQGFQIARPMPASALLTWVSQNQQGL